MTRIFLVGYMGAGKTTVGRALAKSLSLGFIDLDHFIQNRYNKAISRIFEEEGESKFREIESKILKEITGFEDVVVSTGGGAPCFYDNMQAMNESGLTIYLKADSHLLTERLMACKEKRPLIKDKNEEELYRFISDSLTVREPFYSQARIIFEAKEIEDNYNIKKYLSNLIKEIKQYTN